MLSFRIFLLNEPEKPTVEIQNTEIIEPEKPTVEILSTKITLEERKEAVEDEFGAKYTKDWKK